MSQAPKRALVLLLPGLGDAFVASPLFRALAQIGYRLSALTMLRPVSEYARRLSCFDDVTEVPLLERPFESIVPLLRLRQQRYDAVVLPFPATRWQYAFVACILGGRLTFSHKYGGLHSMFLLTVRAAQVPLAGGHRAYENVRLAVATGAASPGPSYEMPESWRANPKHGILGVHPGTMRYKGNEARRWPLERFAALVREETQKGRRVRLFLGPNEQEDRDMLSLAIGEDASVEFVCETLDAAARKVSECEVFVANDSGFAHLAAGLGVQTITLFGMTNPIRATPLGRSVAVRPSNCSPCHDEGLRAFDCRLNIGHACINTDLPVATVVQAVDQAFTQPLSEHIPIISSPFYMYGKFHGVAADISTTGAK